MTFRRSATNFCKVCAWLHALPSPLSYPDIPPVLFGRYFRATRYLKHCARAVIKDKTKKVTVICECSHLQGWELVCPAGCENSGYRPWEQRCISKEWFQWARASFVPATCPLLQKLLYILAPPLPSWSTLSGLPEMLSPMWALSLNFAPNKTYSQLSVCVCFCLFVCQQEYEAHSDSYMGDFFKTQERVSDSHQNRGQHLPVCIKRPEFHPRAGFLFLCS